MTEIKKKLISIFSYILELDANSFDENISQESIDNWDSMNHLLIITEIEKQFGVNIPLEESIELASFKELLNYLIGEKEPIVSSNDYNTIEIRGKLSKILIKKTKSKLEEKYLPQLEAFVKRNYNLTYILLNKTFFDFFFKNYLTKNNYSVEIIQLEDKIIGMLGRIPCKLKVFDNVIDGCFFCNLMIERDYQNQGLGPRLFVDVDKVFDIQMILSYTPNLIPIFQNLGWVEMPHLRRFIKILSVENCTTLAEKEIPIDGGENYFSIIEENGYSFSEINKLDDRIEEFWAHIKVKYPITIERSIDYLNWRYINHPLLIYHFFIIEKNETIQAFIVLRIEDSLNYKIGRIIDFISTDEAEKYSLYQAMNFCLRKKVDLIDYFFTGNFHIESLVKLNFREANEEPYYSIPINFNPINRRKKSINFSFKCNLTLKNTEEFSKIDNWYLTKGDGDQDRPN